MLEVVVRLKQRITCEEFHNDAANAPDIAREAPSKLKNNLWCPIVSGRDYCRMIFIIESGRSKVNKADIAVQ